MKEVTNAMTNGTAEGVKSYSDVPSARNHLLPNKGPYHNPPSTKDDKVATSMAHQLSARMSNVMGRTLLWPNSLHYKSKLKLIKQIVFQLTYGYFSIGIHDYLAVAVGDFREVWTH